MTYDHRARRRQVIAEAIEAQHRATERVVTLLGKRQVTPNAAMQELADTYAVIHGDTEAKQRARRDRLDRDTAAYEVGRPKLGAA